MDAHQTGDAPAPTVWHCFRCSDARTVIDWLVATLGFVETACYSEDGGITHAELLWPEGGGVMLGKGGRGERKGQGTQGSLGAEGYSHSLIQPLLAEVRNAAAS